MITVVEKIEQQIRSTIKKNIQLTGIIARPFCELYLVKSKVKKAAMGMSSVRFALPLLGNFFFKLPIFLNRLYYQTKKNLVPGY